MSSDLNDKLNLISNARNDIKSSLINKGQLVNNDIRTYANAIYNISSGSGDVKLFDTISNMQNSSGNQEGDLAIVYASSQANITEDTEFQVGTFPETVVLSSAITDYIEVGFIPVESSGMFDCGGNLNSSRFSMNIYSDLGDGMCEIRIQYESSDGLTYTRTEFTKNYETVSGDEMDFGTVIKFGSNWRPANWDDRIGQFILAGSVNFNGLFNYVTNIPNYAISYRYRYS